MKGGGERRALAACGDIPAPEISDGGYASAFGDGVGVANLQCKALRTASSARWGAVADGLAVTADCLLPLGLLLRTGQIAAWLRPEQQAQFSVKNPQSLYLVVSRVADGANLLPGLRWYGVLVGVQ